MEASRALAGPHRPKVCPVPALFREHKVRKSLLVWTKKILISNMLSSTSAQKASPAKGLEDSLNFQLIYSALGASLAEQED